MINIILGEIVILLVNFYIMSQLIRYTRKQMQARKASIFAKEAPNQEQYNAFSASPESVLYCLYFFCCLGLLICGCLQALLVFEAEYATLIKLTLFTAVTCVIDILVYYLLVSDADMHKMVDNVYRSVAIVASMFVNVLSILMLVVAIVLPLALYGMAETPYFSVLHLIGITMASLFSIACSTGISASCLSYYITKTNSNCLRILQFFPAITYVFFAFYVLYCLHIYQAMFFTTIQIICIGSLLSGMLLAPELILYLHIGNVYMNNIEDKISIMIHTLQLSCKYVAVVVFFIIFNHVNGMTVVESNLFNTLHKILQYPALLVSLLLASSLTVIYFIILEIIKIILKKTYFPYIITAGKHDAP